MLGVRVKATLSRHVRNVLRDLRLLAHLLLAQKQRGTSPLTRLLRRPHCSRAVSTRLLSENSLRTLEEKDEASEQAERLRRTEEQAESAKA